MTVLEIRRDPIEVTRDGILTGVRDEFRQFIPGPERYFIDDVEVSRDEAQAFMDARGGP